MKRRCNYRDIAKEVGCCVATVSLALRNHPSIPPETRTRVRATADKLGYKPNVRVAELMGEIRKNRSVDTLTEAVALYWSDAPRKTVHQYLHLKQFEDAVRQQCLNAGFELECYYGGEAGGESKVVERILYARGIRGVILAPLILSQSHKLNWKWDHFSVVIAGSALWQPEFHRVRFNHFEEVQKMLSLLSVSEQKRIGLVVDREVNQRSLRLISGAFWAWSSPDLRLQNSVFETIGERKTAFLEWLNTYRPKSLIVASSDAFSWVQELPKKPKLFVLGVELHKDAKLYSGIREDYSRLGDVAARQLFNQLLANETGIPRQPIKLYIVGEWVTVA